MNLRNVAIIAHVDHGKTTLVDAMFRQSGIFRSNQNVEERSMDSGDLEKERGITILSKCTSIVWNDVTINIVDTPGHADFGGEVERILSMVDGVILLVDAAEGPMPQTKFVLTKALKLGLCPIVVINKVDRHDARIDEVLDEIYDLFISLDPSEEQMDFKVLYASGRAGWAVENLEDITENTENTENTEKGMTEKTKEATNENTKRNITPLFEAIIKFVPPPDCKEDAPFSMLVTTREYDNYLGRILTGRINSGQVKENMIVKSLSIEGKVIENCRIQKILTFSGLKKVPVQFAKAGDIVVLAGLQKTSVADTICDLSVTTALPSIPVSPPTLSMTFGANDSPLAGKEGTKLTSRMISDRLKREAEGNVSIKIKEEGEAYEVSGRGELQLGILIETMRREGFEMSIGCIKVLFKHIDGKLFEPIEEVSIDVDTNFVGTVVDAMSSRKGELKSMDNLRGDKSRLIFSCPSRGLIGYHNKFLTDTRGTGVMNRTFLGYELFKGDMEKQRNGVLISTEKGPVTAYALAGLEDRGQMFVKPGVIVYPGMIVGENNKDNDLEINVVRAKQLTNMRASGKDETIRLTPPRVFSLENSLSYIESDEIVEVTPKSIRLRKKILDSSERKKMQRKTKK